MSITDYKDRLCNRQCDIDVEKLLKLNITCCCYSCGWTRTTVVDGCSLYLWYVKCATIMAVDKTDQSQKIRDIVAVITDIYNNYYCCCICGSMEL